MTFARREGEEVIAEFDRDTNTSPIREEVAVVLSQTHDSFCQGPGSSDPGPNLPAAIDLLQRQACNCVHKITCLRCELLGLLA